MNKNMLAVALASLLVGGVAVAAYNSFSNKSAPVATTADGQVLPGQEGDVSADAGIDGNKVEYADVTNVKSVTQKEKLYATVIGSDAIQIGRAHV